MLRTPVSAGTPSEIAAVTAAGDPASVQRFLSLGTNISAALPAQFEVSYQGQVISPIGSTSALRPAVSDDGQGE